MIVVADATPLRYLVLIDETAILPALYDRILIPPAVLRELTRQRFQPMSTHRQQPALQPRSTGHSHPDSKRSVKNHTNTSVSQRRVPRRASFKLNHYRVSSGLRQTECTLSRVACLRDIRECTATRRHKSRASRAGLNGQKFGRTTLGGFTC